MGKKPAKKPSTITRRARLGPFGPSVEVSFTKHALARYFERCFDRGIDQKQLEDAVRAANTKKLDEWDPDYPENSETPRIRRWIQVNTEGGSVRLRVVFIVARQQTDKEPGSILVVTVLEPKGRTGQ